MTIIKDGTGSKRSAEVDTKNRLTTFATTLPECEQAIRDGNSFTIFSGIINLTSPCTSHIFFIKNTGTESFVLDIIELKQGKNTGGSGDYQSITTFNPTTGTLVSCGTVLAAANNNFASANTLCATILSGVEGSTITDGISTSDLLPDDGIRATPKGVVPTGTSLSIGIKPPTGTTSVNVTIAVVVHLVDE